MIDLSSLGEKERATYDMLVAAAEAGHACPCNQEICARLGMRSVASGTRFVSLLEELGLIEVMRMHHERVVTIIASGKRTATLAEERARRRFGLPRDYLLPPEAERVETLVRSVTADLSQGDMARLLGISQSALCQWLQRWGLGWPVNRPQLEALSRMPVMSATTRERERRAEDGRKESAVFFKVSSMRMAEDELEARRAQAQAERRARENYWLEQEQRKYGLPRRGRPLSGMVA